MTRKSEISGITLRRTQNGHITGFIVEVRHAGLNEIRTIADREEDTAIRKAQAIGARWDERWARTQQQKSVQQMEEASKQQVLDRTAVAEKELLDAASILTDAVDNSGPLDWATLEDRRSFEFLHASQYAFLRFGPNGKPVAIKPMEVPREPQSTDAEFRCELTWWDSVWSRGRRKKQEVATARFDEAHKKWRARRDLADVSRKQAEHELATAISHFNAEEGAFLAAQAAANDKVAVLKCRYKSKQPQAVTYIPHIRGRISA